MRLTWLGSGDAFSGGGRGHSALLVDDERGRLLVDCGATVPLALKRLGVKLDSIDAVAITHLHGDHVAGLPFLFLAGMYEERRTRPLPVLGPPLMARQVEAAFDLFYPDVRSRRPFATEFHEVAPGGAAELCGRRFTALRAHHMGGEFAALMFRIESERKVLALSGDTGAAAPLAEVADEADLFVCECTYAAPIPGDKDPKHMSADDIARLRPRWTARRVVLTHLSADARVAARGIAGVEVADDGLVIEV
jgi:ribonuclease BN (tRNA processing enzyme)